MLQILSSSNARFPYQVFIDNPAGQAIKHLYNEKTLEFIRSVEVAAPYPFPYGFFLNTTSGDGDNLDCFVLTTTPIIRGQTVPVEPIGVMEVIENDEIDHKIIAQLEGESARFDDEIKDTLACFIYEVFSDRPDKHMIVGNFLDRAEAIQMILTAKDSNDICPPNKARYYEV